MLFIISNRAVCRDLTSPGHEGTYLRDCSGCFCPVPSAKRGFHRHIIGGIGDIEGSWLDGLVVGLIIGPSGPRRTDDMKCEVSWERRKSS